MVMAQGLCAVLLGISLATSLKQIRLPPLQRHLLSSLPTTSNLQLSSTVLLDESSSSKRQRRRTYRTKRNRQQDDNEQHQQQQQQQQARDQVVKDSDNDNYENTNNSNTMYTTTGRRKLPRMVSLLRRTRLTRQRTSVVASSTTDGPLHLLVPTKTVVSDNNTNILSEASSSDIIRFSFDNDVMDDNDYKIESLHYTTNPNGYIILADNNNNTNTKIVSKWKHSSFISERGSISNNVNLTESKFHLSTDDDNDDDSKRQQQQQQQQQQSSKQQRRAVSSSLSTLLKPISFVRELRRRILDEQIPLSDVTVKLDVQEVSVEDVLNHQVLSILARRFHEQSTPGHRLPNDTDILALSIEGGGMRGAVTAGMAAAIASLGLTDCFDRIYGSSAGSVIGAYMVSRQMCMDVYVDILPAAQRQFVCTKRIVKGLAANAIDLAMSKLPKDAFLRRFPKLLNRSEPGMNISFVLDGIMDHNTGIRPLDIERFHSNNQYQPLRVASSYAKDGKLYTKCFGTESYSSDEQFIAKRVDGVREGIYACLEASMTVPGATGPPVPLVDPNGRHGMDSEGQRSNQSLPFFDAFCFEPLPYRSAVEEGATHVLVLCSRPEGFQPKTQQGIYEKAIAPLYFRSHGHPEVATFFERGGQQYIYAEDLLLLEEAKRAGMKSGNGEPIACPPPRVLYGVDMDDETKSFATNRENWKKAHLFPLKVPIGTPELKTLEQDRDTVLEAVRGGFAAAFDLLAPAIGLDMGKDLTGKQVAQLMFPSKSRYDGSDLLQEQIRIKGDEIILPKRPTPSLESEFLQGPAMIGPTIMASAAATTAAASSSTTSLTRFRQRFAIKRLLFKYPPRQKANPQFITALSGVTGGGGSTTTTTTTGEEEDDNDDTSSSFVSGDSTVGPVIGTVDNSNSDDSSMMMNDTNNDDNDDDNDTVKHILTKMRGFSGGRMAHLASYLQTNDVVEDDKKESKIKTNSPNSPDKPIVPSLQTMLDGM